MHMEILTTITFRNWGQVYMWQKVGTDTCLGWAEGPGEESDNELGLRAL